jgi:molybdopterin molybdotransferase
MISVEEALGKVLAQFRALETERKPLLESLGQVLAEDVYATFDIPPLDNSAMDGYAVRAESTVGASQSSPRSLTVTSEVAAGYLASEEVRPGTTIRIMTGAPLPKGADCVVRFEDTDEVARKSLGQPLTEIGILREAKAGHDVRRAGEDVSCGSLVLAKGTPLRPQEIGVLASLGHETASVYRRPVVAILGTGDELLDVGQAMQPGKIYSSNSYSLAAQVIQYGGIPKLLGIARDSIESLESKIWEARSADILITSAGVSVGDYDIVKDVLARQGDVTFWTVRMKPGKPLAFGVLRLGGRTVPHLGLPGNPVSSMVTFEQFARPAIFKMLGRNDYEKATIHARSESHVENTDGRRTYARVRVRRENGEFVACLTGPQGSGILTSMALANGLMIVPEDVRAVQAGDSVIVHMLDWPNGSHPENGREASK